jgi:hypothetical protein
MTFTDRCGFHKFERQQLSKFVANNYDVNCQINFSKTQRSIKSGQKKIECSKVRFFSLAPLHSLKKMHLLEYEEAQLRKLGVIFQSAIFQFQNHEGRTSTMQRARVCSVLEKPGFGRS